MPAVTHAKKGDRRVIDLFGQTLDFLWDGPETTVMYNVLPRGHGTPMHIHTNMDEAFHVISGEVKVVTDTEEFRSGPGDYVHILRGVSHALVAVSEAPAQLMWVTTPGNYKRFFEEMIDATGGTGEPDLEELGKIAAKHNTILVGPPPDVD